MSVLKLSGWALLFAVGCNGRMTVGDGEGGAPGSAGARDFAGEKGIGGKSGGAGAAGIAGSVADDGSQPGGGLYNNSAGRPGYVDGYSGGFPAGGFGGNDSGDGYGGGFPAGGFGGVSPTPGELGQPCIPGGLLTEADGSPAKTQIRTLAHCNEGMSCNAQSQCVPAPNCPQSGDLCVVHRAALSAGSGGSSGVFNGSNNGAAGAAIGSGGNGQTVYNSSDRSGVITLSASESHVYWVEYGTRDALGNYQHDGALLAYAIADGTTTVVASGLEGPVGVELTTSHAYIYVDGARPIGTPVHSQLLRVPLAGGSAELVQEGARPASFAAAGNRAFWNSDYTTEVNPNIYSMAADANAVPTVFIAGYTNGLATDATDLYYLADQGLMRSPIASAAPVALGGSPGTFVLHDDSIFILESISAGGLLQRGSKSGGEFLRVRALGSGTPSGLQAVGDRYFLSVAQSGMWTNWGFAYTAQVLSAGFVGTDPPVRLLERSRRIMSTDQLWVGTANDLYWSEGRAIYKQPLPTP